MAKRYAGQPRHDAEPRDWEIAAWKRFATVALDVALQRTAKMGQLLELAEDARRLRVFGPEGPSNSCTRLIEIAREAARSSVPRAYLIDLDRLAREILMLCDGHTEVRKAARGI
ncbi:hypothetical protein AEAC466_17300 [Asticcacaulis sp. AC466]|uniref:hypothetical protein n=1 Tax=Asticcacaulis sp. AC466 TaxID=1282362 RepID=UPI0003C3D1EC|nr:hypothetical protein [Asticcacaulis sp. AC466]ESQ82379.1 hypothetical protein AEAC466_17300 [Asticcacaulis sp. AC466]